MEVSISLGLQTFTNFSGTGGPLPFNFGPLYHIAFLKRRPVVTKADFWWSRSSSEAFSSFSSCFSSLASIQCAVPTPPSLNGGYQFSTHPHPPTPASCSCQMSLCLALRCRFCHSYSCLPSFFGYCLTSVAAALSLLVCHSVCPFSHPHTLHPCPT